LRDIRVTAGQGRRQSPGEPDPPLGESSTVIVAQLEYLELFRTFQNFRILSHREREKRKVPTP
jgi:hypothetical protein